MSKYFGKKIMFTIHTHHTHTPHTPHTHTTHTTHIHTTHTPHTPHTHTTHTTHTQVCRSGTLFRCRVMDGLPGRCILPTDVDHPFYYPSVDK